MKLFSISIGTIVIILLVVGGIYYFQNRNTSEVINKYREPATNLTRPGEYVNEEFGFSITYPPESETYMANCEAYKTGKTETAEVGVFSDKDAVYIANKQTVEVKNKEDASGDYGYDWSTCKEVPTTLALIKNGFPNGLPEKYGDKTYPVTMKFTFGKVSNDEELVKIGEKGLGVKDCQIASKKYIKGSNDGYNISLRGQGTAGEMGGTCWINAAYQFIYSPTSKTAVVSMGYQNCFFEKKGKCEIPQAKLLD